MRKQRWELDPASSEDYGERVRTLDAYRAGECVRRWLAERIKQPADISRPRTEPRATAARDS